MSQYQHSAVPLNPADSQMHGTDHPGSAALREAAGGSLYLASSNLHGSLPIPSTTDLDPARPLHQDVSHDLPAAENLPLTCVTTTPEPCKIPNE